VKHEVVQKDLAGPKLVELNELIGGVRLENVAGTTHYGLDAGPLEQPCLGSVGDLAG